MKRLVGVYLTVGFLLHALLNAQEEVTFTQITEGELATDPGHYYGVAWGDYDNDGFVDLFMANTDINHRLYHNNGDGTFSRVMSGTIAEDSPAAGLWPTWIDHDNDGDLDLFVSSRLTTPDRFYRNEGGGTFTRITEGDWVNTLRASNSACWGDLDKDGFVDLYVANTLNQPNYLYMNNGDGTMSGGIDPNTGSRVTHLSVMSDINMDGDVDLLLAQPGMIYLNDGGGNLTAASGPPVHRGTWEDHDIPPADYDNDGDLDLVVVGFLGNRLYLNDGAGGFTEVTEGAIFSLYDAPNYQPNACAAWGDYDNDGKLDLFIARANVDGIPFADLLYHNEGNGIFSQVMDISLVNREGYSETASWADYDNDGDLDLIVTDGNSSTTPLPSVLYRNDGGNQKNWLLLSLKGTVSNGSALGAKVYVTATIEGETVTQLREINGRNTELRTHFGLGDATVVDEVWIQWPSGAIQTMTGVKVDQIVTITELPWPWPTVNGNSDTTPWMGWLWVGSQPWAWSYSLNKYIYCPAENISEAGGWVYIP